MEGGWGIWERGLLWAVGDKTTPGRRPEKKQRDGPPNQGVNPPIHERSAALPATISCRRGPGHAESVSLEGGVACSPSPAHAAAAGCRTDRDPDEIRQAARLATWEDEGGTTSS